MREKLNVATVYKADSANPNVAVCEDNHRPHCFSSDSEQQFQQVAVTVEFASHSPQGFQGEVSGGWR
jgi:hypothetical protein